MTETHERKIEDYEDIIDLPHHVSLGRSHISAEMRAAQFSPFAALTGYGDEVSEAARLTESKHELDEHEKMMIDINLRLSLSDGKQIQITYFVSDDKKAGGKYISVTDHIIENDEISQEIVMSNGTRISIDNIIAAEITESIY